MPYVWARIKNLNPETLSHSSARACSRTTGRTKMPSLGASVKGDLMASGTCPGDSSKVNLRRPSPRLQAERASSLHLQALQDE